MLVHRAAAQIAAPRQGDLRPAKPAEQSAHQIIAGTDLPSQLIGHLTVADMGAVHLYGGPVHSADVGAQLLQNLENQRHIADLRDIFNAAYPVYQQGGGNNGDSGVFGSADVDGSVEGIPSVDQILCQRTAPSFPSLGIYEDMAGTPYVISKLRPCFNQGMANQMYYSTIIPRLQQKLRGCERIVKKDGQREKNCSSAV